MKSVCSHCLSKAWRQQKRTVPDWRSRYKSDYPSITTGLLAPFSAVHAAQKQLIVLPCLAK
ncbi:MAG: hypothetical protein F6K48_08665 [Okeania sp. SIO3H1]|nr:hypothetical protein [Okeania sp. SIO3H1]